MPESMSRPKFTKEKTMSSKRMTKSQFVTTLATKGGLSKKQITAVLDAINETVAQQLGRKGPGEVMIPGLLKLSTVVKPATQKHEGLNPFTKQPMTFQAKPARKVVRVRPLKALKDAI